MTPTLISEYFLQQLLWLPLLVPQLLMDTPA
jgi:hypothetical protein